MYHWKVASGLSETKARVRRASSEQLYISHQVGFRDYNAMMKSSRRVCFDEATWEKDSLR